MLAVNAFFSSSLTCGPSGLLGVLAANCLLELQFRLFLVDTPVIVLTPSAILHICICCDLSTNALVKSAP